MGFILSRKSCLVWLIWIEFKIQSRETYQNVLSPLTGNLISASISGKQTRREQCCHGFSHHISWYIDHFFWFGFQQEGPSCSNTCRDRMGHPGCPTPGSCDAETVEAKCRSAWAAKLALRLPRVYLFFQIVVLFLQREPVPRLSVWRASATRLQASANPCAESVLNAAPGMRPRLLRLRGAEQGGSGPNPGHVLPLVGFRWPDFKCIYRAPQHCSEVTVL